MKGILYLKKSEIAGKKHYLCAYEKTHFNIINVYPFYNGCTEYHVGINSHTSGK